jgi:carboxypeptidase D
MPTSKTSNDSQLYFWFFPSENPDAGDEIMIWLNGGVSETCLDTSIAPHF